MNPLKRRGAFISYSRRDKEFALELARELRAAGDLVWLDQLDIPTGARWDDEVEIALREHKILLIILIPRLSHRNQMRLLQIAMALRLRSPLTLCVGAPVRRILSY